MFIPFLFLPSPGSCVVWMVVVSADSRSSLPLVCIFLSALWHGSSSNCKRVSSARQEKTVCFIDKESGWLVLRERSCYCGNQDSMAGQALYCRVSRDPVTRRILEWLWENWEFVNGSSVPLCHHCHSRCTMQSAVAGAKWECRQW